MARDGAMPQPDDEAEAMLTGVAHMHAAGLGQRHAAAMSHELSQQDADEVLAKDLAEKVLRERKIHGSGVMVAVDPSTTARTIAGALSLLFTRNGYASSVAIYHRGELCIVPR